jgi:hypothetical protein
MTMEKDTSRCRPDCTEHVEHVYILCYGAPTLVGDRDHLSDDPSLGYPITHYVGWTRQQPPIKRIRSHGARSAHFIAQIRPGTLHDEYAIKRTQPCPSCGSSLWYYAESPTYPGATPARGPEPADVAARNRAAAASFSRVAARRGRAGSPAPGLGRDALRAERRRAPGR